MTNLKTRLDWKYFKIELLFFAIICYLTPVIGDIEYRFHETNNVWGFTEVLEYRITVGTFLFIFYASYYWLFLKPFLLKKQVLYICISIIGFLLVDHLYDKYVLNLGMSKLWFISDELRRTALKNYNNERFFFKMSYFLNRIVFTIIGFSFLIRSLQQDEQLKTLKEQQLISELTYLKAQLQPHFFFNTLNNIYALALKQSKETAPLVAKLAEMMRYILYRSEEKLVALKEEIAFLQNYVEVENIRYRSAIHINFDVQGVNNESTISPLLLLPFIENAFKHGVQEETEKGFVTIIFCKTKDELTLEVANSIADSGKEKISGIGLANVQKRLDILYPGNYKMEVENDGRVYKVRLTLTIT